MSSRSVFLTRAAGATGGGGGRGGGLYRAALSLGGLDTAGARGKPEAGWRLFLSVACKKLGVGTAEGARAFLAANNAEVARCAYGARAGAAALKAESGTRRVAPAQPRAAVESSRPSRPTDAMRETSPCRTRASPRGTRALQAARTGRRRAASALPGRRALGPLCAVVVAF